MSKQIHIQIVKKKKRCHEQQCIQAVRLAAALFPGPLTKPSWSSLERSSSDLFMVSGRRSVEKIPVNMKKAKISRICFTN